MTMKNKNLKNKKHKIIMLIIYIYTILMIMTSRGLYIMIVRKFKIVSILTL